MPNNPHYPECGLHRPAFTRTSSCTCRAQQRMQDVAFIEANDLKTLDDIVRFVNANRLGRFDIGALHQALAQSQTNRIVELLQQPGTTNAAKAARKLAKYRMDIHFAGDLANQLKARDYGKGKKNKVKKLPAEDPGQHNVAAEQSAGPSVNTPQSQVVPSPWSWQYPGVQQIGQQPVRLTAFEADTALRRANAEREAASVRLSRQGLSQSSLERRKALIAASLQGGHGNDDQTGRPKVSR